LCLESHCNSAKLGSTKLFAFSCLLCDADYAMWKCLGDFGIGKAQEMWINMNFVMCASSYIRF